MASVDPLADNKGFAAQQQADFPLLSDVSKKVARAFGVLSGSGFAKRHTFYMNGEGKIMAIDRRVNPTLRPKIWPQHSRQELQRATRYSVTNNSSK